MGKEEKSANILGRARIRKEKEESHTTQHNTSKNNSPHNMFGRLLFIASPRLGDKTRVKTQGDRTG
jgi:hypothetical protein